MGTDADRAALERVNRALGGPPGAQGVSERTHKSGGEGQSGSDLRNSLGAPGQIRTADTRFRRAVLYPLSYEGGAGSAPQEG